MMLEAYGGSSENSSENGDLSAFFSVQNHEKNGEKWLIYEWVHNKSYKINIYMKTLRIIWERYYFSTNDILFLLEINKFILIHIVLVFQN